MAIEKLIVTALALLAMTLVATASEFRKFHNSKGKFFVARVISKTEKIVVLERQSDGVKFNVDVAVLSENNQRRSIHSISFVTYRISHRG